MNELRQDPITGDWVIMAPDRGARPHAVPAAPDRTRRAEPCPFCPGNEFQTPPELWRLTGADGAWRIRVVPNKFAALTPIDAPTRGAEGFVAMAAYGHHEVIIESPCHNADLATVAVAQVTAVLAAYRQRYRALAASSGTALIVIFRNHGSASGTSLDHPHSQIVSTPFVPPQAQQRLEHARRHFDRTHVNLYADVLGNELRDGRRIVSTRSDLVAFQPYASIVPFETWIVPRHPQASFGHIDDSVLDQLAGMTRVVLGGLREVLHDPPYNLVVHSSPLSDENNDYFSWHLQIVPRLGIAAGFELGTGMAINSVVPERAAAALRAAVGRQIAAGV
ncbi:galactose-1-phosphate uridylyltransferase [Hamadaea sp. NPDC050747]|uniref:galactose-1-phosphate uridylyltransferase n=1 Tax=Hamadaea sp. NPDC050747 TaxID=3155789 RepID=UPI0033D44693